VCVCVCLGYETKENRWFGLCSSSGSRIQRTNALLPRVGLFAIPGIAAGRRPGGFDESRPLHLGHSHSRRYKRYRPRRRTGSCPGWFLFLFFLFPFLNLIFIIIILLCSFLVLAKEIRITLKRNVIRQSVPFLRTPAAAFPWEYRPTLKESIRKSHRFWLVCRCVSNPVVDGSSLNRNENDDDSKRKSLSLQSPRISIGATGQM
jgi:hypothetical protein